MIRTLHIRSSFDPGGTENLLLHLFNHNQPFIEIHMVFIKNGTLINELKNKYNFYYLLFRKRFLDLGVIFKINRILKKKRIYIVHAHQEIELLYAFCLKILNPKIKIFYSIHLMREKKDLVYLMEKVLLPFTYQIIAVSYAVKSHLIHSDYPYKKIKVLYNAVKKPTNITEYDKVYFLNKIKYDVKDYLILMIGNFRPEKDHLTLLKAFNRIKSVYKNLKLIFIGKINQYTDECIKHTCYADFNQRIFYLDRLPDASKYIQLCDLFVFSSKSETFGVSVIEALLSKKSVIASDIPVMKELSSNGRYFELFETGNDKELAEKIENCISNKCQIKEKIEEAYNYASSNFNYDTYVEHLMKIYNA
ncbi:glycosyltransferase family 4 protein [Melioribacter sp. OK-6-Me]|uniref:glycosyltransferase family 4 protein n=1 Tax=Melioribacter sp. OK-6-Me TaxID=3423433 RepID=UPI003ED8491F